ncbi:MAG: patatin-like phospholipase family protein [Bacteroidia bacterium]
MEHKPEAYSTAGHEKKEKLPAAPFSNIAISLSGGGFRGTAFHLGTLTYLSAQTWNGISLLERVRILSTVSAGTFTGIKYAATIKKGGSVQDCYRELYQFMSKCDLVSEALQYLSDDRNWEKGRQRTLINAFAAIYHREFESGLFGLLWNPKPEIHLKEISFNATEFNFALPFRFQKTETRGDDPAKEYIGNKKIHIPIGPAKEIRLADIAAASSCFPFGFEPINFPDDFIHEDSEKLKDMSLLPHEVYNGDKIDYPVGLMDGSIDDNQGVDAVVMAEARMKSYPPELKDAHSKDAKAIDLYLISDVSPSKMESYIRSTDTKIRVGAKWNFKSLRDFGIVSAALGFVSIVAAAYVSTRFLIIALSIFGTLDILVALVLLIASKGLTGLNRKLGVPDFVVRRLLHFDKLKFGTLLNMLVNRRRSGMKMVSDVFLRQMRWFSLERVYGDPAWKPRLSMNTIFKLTEDEVLKRKKKYSYLSGELLDPGEDIILAASSASRMSTTLWFTPQELEGHRNILNTLIACGQFTVCFTLLEYMERYMKNKDYEADYNAYSEDTKKAIEELYDRLMKDWMHFKKNPYWMVNEWNKLNSDQ